MSKVYHKNSIDYQVCLKSKDRIFFYLSSNQVRNSVEKENIFSKIATSIW